MADSEKKQGTTHRSTHNDENSSDSTPEWILTFSDMMTLLLCFFVLLFAFANHDVEKFRSIMGSIQNAFGVQAQRKEDVFAAYSPTRFERDQIEKDSRTRELITLKLDLLRSIQPDPDMAKVCEVLVQSKAVILRIPTNMLFKKDSAELLPDVNKRLDRLVNFLSEHKLFGSVKAHTSNIPPISQHFPGNWELSAARASVLLHKLLNDYPHLQRNHFKASGYADTQPLLPNTSRENQEKNDRIEIYFYSPNVELW